MPNDKKLERAIREVIETNHYSEEQEKQFRKFMKELVSKYNDIDKTTAPTADSMITEMEQGIDVLGEEQKEYSAKSM